MLAVSVDVLLLVRQDFLISAAARRKFAGDMHGQRRIAKTHLQLRTQALPTATGIDQARRPQRDPGDHLAPGQTEHGLVRLCPLAGQAGQGAVGVAVILLDRLVDPLQASRWAWAIRHRDRPPAVSQAAASKRVPASS